MLVCCAACVNLAFKDPSCDNRVIGESPDLTQNVAFERAEIGQLTRNNEAIRRAGAREFVEEFGRRRDLRTQPLLSGVISHNLAHVTSLPLSFCGAQSDIYINSRS